MLAPRVCAVWQLRLTSDLMALRMSTANSQHTSAAVRSIDAVFDTSTLPLARPLPRISQRIITTTCTRSGLRTGSQPSSVNARCSSVRLLLLPSYC